MKSFIYTRSVAGSLSKMIDTFCSINNIENPIEHDYEIDDRIPMKEWLRILSYLDKAYQKQDLVVALAKICTADDIGILAYLCMSCENIREVFTRYFKYQKLFYDLTPISVIETQQYYILSWDNPAYLDTGFYVKETLMARNLNLLIFHNFINTLVSPYKIKIQRIEFNYPRPAHAKNYESHLDCSFIYEAKQNRLVYCQESLKINISNNNDSLLKRILEKNADELLTQFPDDISFKEFVSRSILASIQDKSPDIEYTAKKIGISTRLLQYRLKNLGTSFSEQMSLIKKTLALQYLENDQLSISAISELLAYKEQSSFNHAFKSWTGLSPNQWRQQRTGKLRIPKANPQTTQTLRR